MSSAQDKTSGIESVIDPEYMQSVDGRLESYDAYIDYQMREARRAIPFLSRFFRIENARVLEVGTGRGGKGIAYASAGMNVIALDVDEESLRLAAHAASTHDANVQFLAGDGAGLPFPEDFFDAILIDSVLEHVRDPFAVLLECKRVLKRGGIIFVIFPPYYGPLSGHIDDFIMVPWFHLLSRQVVKNALLSRHQPKGILTPEYSYRVYTSLNRLTIFGFRQMVNRVGLKYAFFRVRPFLTHPGTRLAVGPLSALMHPPRLKKLRAAWSRAWREFNWGTLLLFIWLALIAPLVLVPFLQEIAAGACKAVLRKT